MTLAVFLRTEPSLRPHAGPPAPKFSLAVAWTIPVKQMIVYLAPGVADASGLTWTDGD
jgi:hypothetical protein